MSFSYLVYGLKLASDLSIPGLLEIPHNDPDVTLVLGSTPDWLLRANALPAVELLTRPSEDEVGEPAFVLSALGDAEFFRLQYSDGTSFILDRSGTRLWGTYSRPMVFDDLVTYLLGPVLGFVLRRRGVLALHASSFAVDGHAVVLSGASEAGKSTTAAALALRGEMILCEDICPVAEERGGNFVEPGYPRVCLWPDSVEMLPGAPEAYPRLTPNWEKRYLPLDGARSGFAAKRLPLGAIYLFGPRVADVDAPRIEPLTPRMALLDLVQNTYMNFVLDREQRAAEFDALSRMVLRVPARRIVPHEDPSRLGELCDLLRKDAGRLLALEPAASAARNG